MVPFIREGPAGFLRHVWVNIVLGSDPHDWTAVAMGTFDGPTNTSLSLHVFVSEKGGYYEIDDGLPQNER